MSEITAEKLLENPEIRKAANALRPKPGSGESVTLTTFGPNGESVTLRDPLMGEEKMQADVAELTAGTELFKMEPRQARLVEETTGIPLITEALEGDHPQLLAFQQYLSDEVKAIDASIAKKEAERKGLEFMLMALQGQIHVNEKALSEHRAAIAAGQEEAARVAVEENAVREAELDREAV